MHKERDQDVKRLKTTSYEERVKERGFAPGVQGNCLHVFEGLSKRREIRLILQGPKGWKGNLQIEPLE